MKPSAEVKANAKRDVVEAFGAAEAALEIWAGVLADDDADGDAADALRLKNDLIRYRCDFTP